MEVVNTSALTQLPHSNAAVDLDIDWLQITGCVMVSNSLNTKSKF